MVALNIYGSLVLKLLHITLQTPSSLWWLLDFWELCVPLSYNMLYNLCG